MEGRGRMRSTCPITEGEGNVLYMVGEGSVMVHLTVNFYMCVVTTSSLHT